MSITERITAIRESLPKGVELVAVSKFHPAESIKEAYEAGQRIFGESRVQELVQKQSLLPNDIEWHMIGHQQTNKVRQIVPFVSLIHSVDSSRLLELINREAERIGRTVECLLEVHVAAEESKSGWDTDALRAYVASGAVRQLGSVKIRGIMGMATLTDDDVIIRHDFEQLAAIKAELEPMMGDDFNILSMGMSDDYQIAIEQGSTMVRIGSSIFGRRAY
jgi:pyridoxal phosphate enzyme (YggS family)